ncbi:MAG: NAD(P) transhydrogenase subunit beta [Rhodanobacter sp. 68-29]|uniref:NAD(P)(+) transhydrogenase (Re/Si-specific) subunit beta n=1 Tax=Rhodanobacter sp. PCA2 TaxID=2006117 RepID=UPI000868E573|nr:NAD(P)(+) transhydrogenase (Re/Si-specific) subunit beta [Rhodanobacter sp. PCA2]MBA2077501.1 NAD(P) transhydrogenase subunit beta [Rhodanobacter sp. PCA2]MBN8923429.1 NAD(P)(+) transhydrogenase (Re/Si-specific) subunit beta [Rhodanobacter sp.]ODU73911.1 MAG: NAD(P) transhydrogenase subunit beta [Rhodanobacter sp. SCN 69-32]OJY55296.1 MAG: NAD(P) transhydrogenase subunit beta [Rhodanobacter sp. 68-29]
MNWLPTLVKACYFLAALLFILGLKRMSSPRTARGGIVWAGVGMLLAVLATFALPDMHNRGLILAAVLIGVAAAWWSGRRVAMTAMPQMVALYNGMGGGAAAGIGAVELVAHVRRALPGIPDTSPLRPEAWAIDAVHQAQAGAPEPLSAVALALGVLGALIGAVSFSGSLVAFAKLQGWMDKRFVFPGQRVVNLLVLLAALVLGVILATGHLTLPVIVAFFALSLLFGLLMTLPIGGADMPVVISLYNAFTGLAVAFEGYVLGNEAMIIAGMVVGAAGTLLTQLMAKAMNRSLGNVLFGSFGAAAGGVAQEIAGAQKPIDAADAAVMMAYAERVAIVPGYGMAVAQAQHKVWEFAKLLIERGVKVKFAIHPVAGRMPGHMNVLLAEAGVPYDLIEDMDDINPEFPNTDVVLVIGANDVVNPMAKTDPTSPIYGMPILDVAAAKHVIVVKRGKGTGFAGIENALFYADNTRMLYGDGQAAAGQLVSELKTLDG